MELGCRLHGERLNVLNSNGQSYSLGSPDANAAEPGGSKAKI